MFHMYISISGFFKRRHVNQDLIINSVDFMKTCFSSNILGQTREPQASTCDGVVDAGGVPPDYGYIPENERLDTQFLRGLGKVNPLKYAIFGNYVRFLGCNLNNLPLLLDCQGFQSVSTDFINWISVVASILYCGRSE